MYQLMLEVFPFYFALTLIVFVSVVISPLPSVAKVTEFLLEKILNIYNKESFVDKISLPHYNIDNHFRLFVVKVNLYCHNDVKCAPIHH